MTLVLMHGKEASSVIKFRVIFRVRVRVSDGLRVSVSVVAFE